MKYEHQINWANTYDNNLDISISRFVWNRSINLIFTLTLHPPKQMANFEVCTLYDRKNRNNSYDFLRIKRVHALDSSVSFKRIYVDFTLLFNPYRQFLFLPSSLTILFCFVLFCTRYKHYEFFHSVWFDENSPFYISPSITLIFPVLKRN